MRTGEISCLSDNEFSLQRRDPVLDYTVYRHKVAAIIENFEFMTSTFLAERAHAPDCSPSDLSASSNATAWDSVTHMHIGYSAGIPIDSIRSFFPTAIQYWREYAHYHEAYHRSPTSPYVVAHLPLQDEGYWDAIRLTSFAILLGHTDQMPALCALWDYGNQPLDGLLERLVAPFVPGRPPPPGTCTRHLPYFKLLKVFDAPHSARPALMSMYMDEWYTASRQEPYFGSHTKGREHSYLGLWSFEAAAVSVLLGIDDSNYRNKDFYPGELAGFARSLSPSAAQESGDYGDSV